MAACRLSSGVPYCQLDDGCTHAALEKVNNELKVDSLWIYSFYRIAQSKEIELELVNGLRSKDVIHSVAGLYASVLQSMELETIYDGLSHKDSFTIVASSDCANATSHLQDRICAKLEKSGIEKNTVFNLDSIRAALEKTIADYQDNNPVSTENEENGVNCGQNADTNQDQLEGEGESDCESENEFRMVYSSEFSDNCTESESTGNSTTNDKPNTEVESHNSDELDLMSGYQAFIGSCLHRKMLLVNALAKQKEEGIAQQATLSPFLGVEHRIMASITFRIRYLHRTQRIVHIIFLAVRHHCRKRRLGSILMHLIKDPQVVGPYDAIVVHADINAQQFFKRFGFTDDVMINQRWSELAEEYTNCRLMTFVPGFDGSILRPSASMLHTWLPDDGWIAKFDKEFEAFSQKSESAHCANMFFYRKVREEMIRLNQSIRSQRGMIKELCEELRHCYRQHLLRLKLRKTKSVADADSYEADVHAPVVDSVIGNPEGTEQRLIKRVAELEQQLAALKMSHMTASTPQTVHWPDPGASGDDDDDGADEISGDLNDDTESFETTSNEAVNVESVKVNHCEDNQKQLEQQKCNDRRDTQEHLYRSTSPV